MKTVKLLVATALGVAAMSSQAAYVTGSLSLNDGFVDPYGLVSLATSFDIDNQGVINSPNGDFSSYLAANDPFANPGVVDTGTPSGTLFTAGGFTFTLTSASISQTGALSCFGGLCEDSRKVLVGGAVTGNGFESTAWIGSFTTQGSCLGSAGACTGDYSASWSLSLSALGREVPEPASLALVGLGLMISAGAAKRRRAK